MKKVLIFLIIFIAFVLGLRLADSGTSTSKLLETEIDQFEEQITKPENEYRPKQYIPEENIVNKTARKIDSIIEKIIDKLKSIVKKI